MIVYPKLGKRRNVTQRNGCLETSTGLNAAENTANHRNRWKFLNWGVPMLKIWYNELSVKLRMCVILSRQSGRFCRSSR
jgi:hypothetical protein